MQGVANGILPRLRPPWRGEGRKPREGNAVHRLESSRLGPRRRTQAHVPAGGGGEHGQNGRAPRLGVGNSQQGRAGRFEAVSRPPKAEAGPGSAPRHEWAEPPSWKCLRPPAGARRSAAVCTVPQWYGCGCGGWAQSVLLASLRGREPFRAAIPRWEGRGSRRGP